MPTPLRTAERLALAALLALASATCTDQPTEPGSGHAAQVRFTPVFAATTFAQGLPLDNVTVTVVRPAAETLAVVNAPFNVADSVLQLDIPVTLLTPNEELEVTITLLSGVSILFRGVDTIPVTSGTSTQAPAITLQYVGPGANIAFLSVTPADTVLSFGDTLVFGATASDALENPVPDFYLRWYTSGGTVTIRSDGRVIAPNVRSTVKIHAWTPSGEQDSTSLTFVPVPTQLLKIGGDLQSDTAGDTLSAAFMVEVRAADNLPVQGIPVTFAAVTAGGAVVNTGGVTDSLGRASTTGVLGDTVRTYSYTATIAGVTPVTFQATANAGPAALIAKVSGDAQSDTTGQVLTLPLVVRVADATDNAVAGAAVVWTRVYGTGTPSADTVVTNGSGNAQVTYTLGTPGTDSIQAQIAGTGATVMFTATAVAGGIQVVAVAGDSQADTVARLLTDSLVVETQALGTGTPIGGVQVVWVVQGGNGILSADTVVSDSLGRAAVTLTLGTTAGEVEVLVDAFQGGPLGVFHHTALADAPATLAFVTPPPASTPAGAVVVPAPVIAVRDSFGNNVLQAGLVIRAVTTSMVFAPPVQGSASGGLQFAGSVAGKDSALTTAAGVAAFDSLVVTGTVGPETFRFTVDSLVLPTLISDTFQITPGTPSSVIAANGSGQTAFVDSVVAVAPQALVVDGSGNGVPGITVTFVVTGGGGSITGETVITDSLGYATVGSWTLGSTPGPNTLEAQVSGVSAAIFTANGQPLTPTILLTLLNTNVVGVGRTATLKVALSSPDTAGVVVSLTNLNAAVVTLDTGSATFGPVDTARFRVLTGVSEGTADIIASAPGYIPDTLTVTGSLNLITLPTTANVAFGQTASLPVQLALPAPAGGVVVNVTSLDPSKVSVLTPTVTFNSGEQLKNATVSGVAVGSAAVVAENPNYAPDTSLVSTTAALNFVATSVTAFSTFGAQYTVEFRSAGSLTPAPAGGITVTLTPQDPSCVSAPGTILIPQGQNSVNDSLDYGGVAGLPCTTYLVATAPGIDPDSIQVTINPPPAAAINFTTVEIGSGLQYGSYNVNLAVSAHGGRLVSVRSLTPGVALIQRDAVTAGADSIGVFVPNGTGSMSFYIAGLEGIGSDSALVVAEVPGFRPDTSKVYVRQGAFELVGVPGAVNVLAGNSNVYVQMGIGNPANTAMNAYQGPRVGGSLSRLATVALSSSTVAQLRDSTATPDTVKTVTFPVGQYYTPTGLPGGMQIDPIGVGSVVVTASVPAMVPLPTATRTYAVNASFLSLPTSVEVGAGLQYGSYSLGLSGSNHGGTTVKLKVLSPGVGLVQPDGSTAGTDSLDFAIPNGTASANFWVAGLEGILNDTAFVEASAPGFLTDTMLVFVRQPAIELVGVPANTGSLSANTNIYVQVGIGNPANTAMNAYQGPRVGGTLGRVASVSVAPGTVAILRDSTATPDSTKTVTIPVGQYYSPTSLPQGLQLDPLVPGSAVFTASLVDFVPLPGATRTMTVNGPVITMSASAEIGSGLQYGSYSVNLGATAHGGVTLTLRTLTPGVAVIQTNSTTVGVDSVDYAIPNGTGSFNFWLGGLEGVTSDSTLVVAEVIGFAPDTMKVVVRRAAFELQGVPANTTTLSSNSNVYIQFGVPNQAGTAMNAYQGSRMGGTTPTFYIRSDAPTVVRIADSATTGDSLAVTAPAGQYYTPTTVGSGGLAVDPFSTGSTSIVALHPVFLPLAGATRPITVSTPAITVNAGIVGSGLQRQQSFTLGGGTQHGGVNVVVKSSAPGVMKVAPNASTPGTDSIVVFVANGGNSGNFYIQGMEDSTGTPTISVSAPGFTDGSAGATVVTPAIELAALTATTTAGAANTQFYAQIGVANGVYTAMNEYQNRRAGGPGIVVTFSNSATGIAQLVTTVLTADTVTATIPVGQYYTPTSVVSGGVAFDPLTAGTTVINATAAGFIALPNIPFTVTVNP